MRISVEIVPRERYHKGGYPWPGMHDEKGAMMRQVFSDCGPLNRLARRSRVLAIGALFVAAIVSPLACPQAEGQEQQAPPKNGVDVVANTTNHVNAVAVSSDGKLVAGGGMDNSVRIWRLISGELVHRFEGSQRIIRTVAFQPKGSLLASAGDEPVVRIWDVAAGAQVKTLSGLSPTVRSICFSHDGKLLAGGSFRQKGPKQWQGEVVVWDVASGEVVRVLESQANGYYRGVAFSPDGSLLGAAFDSTGESRSSGVKLWDSKTWELKQTLIRDRGASLSVAFSPDGRYVASGGGFVDVKDGRMATGEVKIWEIATANIVGELARPAGGGYVAVAFSPFGSIAGQGFGPAVETTTGTSVISEVTHWNPATEQPTWNIRCAFCGDATPPAFTPDGTKLITCDNDAVRVFDAETGETLHLLMKAERSPVGSKTESRGLAADGVTMISVHTAGSDKQDIQDFVDQARLDCPVYVDSPEPGDTTRWGNLFAKLAVRELPHTFVVDRDGKIVAHGRVDKMIALARAKAVEQQ